MTTAYVVPCGAAKLDREAPARDLYTSDHFRRQLRAAELACEEGDVVLVLSALYGLVELDEVLEPYDLRMDQQHSTSAYTLALQLRALGITEVYALLPSKYYRRLREAGDLVDVLVFDVYEDSRGVGHQASIAGHIINNELSRSAA